MKRQTCHRTHRALAEGERDASERMARLSVREVDEQDGDLVAAGIYKQVVLDAVPLMVAKELSKVERKETKRGETTLIYGEISFPAMALILEKVWRPLTQDYRISDYPIMCL